MVCANCEQTLKDKDIIMCDSCSRAVHRECSDLNASELKVMDLKGKRVLRYYCEDCQAGIKLIPKLLTKVDQLEAELMLIKSQNQQPTLSEEIVISEIQERQKRASNVMFYNLPENLNDPQEVTTISKNITDINDLKVMKAIRVGKANKNGARPLKVIFNSPDVALMVIRNKRKINTNRKIFIEPDMTPQQLINMNKLKDELRNRKTKGEKVAIKYTNGIPQITHLN